MSLIDRSQPIAVELRKTRGVFSLHRDGSPFYVKGAGGFERLELLAQCGANAVRTWGSEQTEIALPQIRNTGLTLCAGLWMEPPRRGFNYRDATAVAAQADRIRREVCQFKDEPSLLLWGLGNELDLGSVADASTWLAVEELASYIKSVDPLHPVMTVLASANEQALGDIERYCPSIDLVGINSYGDIEMVQPLLREMGWKRPYLITEWGANGSWEVEKTPWGAEIEPTSTEKAEQIRRRLRCVGEVNQCLGSFAFLWGGKQETTPTWYGLLSPEGRTTEAIEVLKAFWSESREIGQTPRISPLTLNGQDVSRGVELAGGVSVTGAYELQRGWAEDLEERWTIRRECSCKGVGGDAEKAAATVEVVIEALEPGQIRFIAPREPGGYRLFLEVLGPNETVATANFPFLVK